MRLAPAEDALAGLLLGKADLTCRQGTVQLRVKIGTVDLWAEAGLLTPFHRERVGLAFEHDAAAQFRPDYVFSDEAAALLGVDKLTVQKWARTRRLKPAGVDAGLQYVFQRGEVPGMAVDRGAVGK